jgi:hypothetical protein
MSRFFFEDPCARRFPEGNINHRSDQLVDDVRLAGFSLPWNAMPDAGTLAPGIPKSNFWASDPNGINQVGCPYTPQGPEFA